MCIRFYKVREGEKKGKEIERKKEIERQREKKENERQIGKQRDREH